MGYCREDNGSPYPGRAYTPGRARLRRAVDRRVVHQLELGRNSRYIVLKFVTKDQWETARGPSPLVGVSYSHTERVITGRHSVDLLGTYGLIIGLIRVKREHHFRARSALAARLALAPAIEH